MNNESTNRHDKIKYYAFDWDDNLKRMLTSIYLLEYGKETSISTSEFAKIREKLIDKPGYKGLEFLPDGESFRDFTVRGDEQFKTEALDAEIGPSWSQLVTCINNASIPSIITARGHTRKAFSDVFKEMIITNHNGIDFDSMVNSMKFFLSLARNKGLNTSVPLEGINYPKDKEGILDYYLKLAKFYPVSNPEVAKELGFDSKSPSAEIAKIKALSHFINYIKESAANLIQDGYTPSISIGFSDDDKKTIEAIKEILRNCEGINPFLWDTSSGKVVQHHLK